jgi:hypothetical protein
MKYLYILLLLALFGLASCGSGEEIGVAPTNTVPPQPSETPASSQTTPSPPSQELSPTPFTDPPLPIGPLTVDIMELVGSPRLIQLVSSFQAAAQKNPDWWLEYVQENSDIEGELPYHPNMGLSEAEYEEMLALSDKMSLGKVGETVLLVEQRPDGRIVLDGGERLPELTGILIDVAQDRVKTPYGMTTTTSTIKASSEQQATGPWNGTNWKLERGNPLGGDALGIQFAIGKYVEKEQGIIYYRVAQVKDGAQTVDLTIFLNFDLE